MTMPNDNQPAKSYIEAVMARADGATPQRWHFDGIVMREGVEYVVANHEPSGGQCQVRQDDFRAGKWDFLNEPYNKRDTQTLAKIALRAIEALEDVANNRCEYESDGRMMRAAAKNVLADINALAAKGSQ